MKEKQKKVESQVIKTQKKQQRCMINQPPIIKIQQNDTHTNKQIQHQTQSTAYNKLLSPANPIISPDKSCDQDINFRLLNSLTDRNITRREQTVKQRKIKLTKKTILQIQNKQLLQIMTLQNGYDQNNLIYRKFNNKHLNQLNHKKYFASIFSTFIISHNKDIQVEIKLPQVQQKNGVKTNEQTNEVKKYQQTNSVNTYEQRKVSKIPRSLIQNIDCQLQFNSNYQSGNLLCVYKTGQYTYDLILQNDLNTTGCTQWYNFTINNKTNKNILATFNIVNLYKSSSLYNKGMKPMVMSTKSNKRWKRKGQEIYYQRNQFSREYSSKFYYSLTFKYDFTVENDLVQFAHAVPYTYQRLLQFLKNIKSHKCEIKSIGLTALKKKIPIIKFQSGQKLANPSIILLARQHPGQTQSSFTIQKLSQLLLKPSIQSQFLLSHFNIYIIPMINIDGVCLGNYRSNGMGFDLNRNWDQQDRNRCPEVFYVKKEIKRIMTTSNVELIIDLHGHSRKLNSFFYGNPFGPNPYLFPYIAAKNHPFVSYEDCTFSVEKKQKAKTARSILGNLIKQTGNVYTYQMSFYGGQRNGKIINFYEQNFRQLGQNLLMSIYKTYVERYKEQKASKQSVYLKQIRKQISKINHQLLGQNSGSDSQIDSQREQLEALKRQEIKEKIIQFRQEKLKMQSVKTLHDEDLIQQKSANDKQLLKAEMECCKSSDLGSIKHIFKPQQSLKRRNSEFKAFKSQENIIQQIKNHKSSITKLKIFGQKFFKKPQMSCEVVPQQQRSSPSKSLRLPIPSIFQQRSNQVSKLSISPISKRTSKRQVNFSTLIPSSRWSEDEIIINDMQNIELFFSVRVNRLQYKKIERHTKDKAGKGVFMLPKLTRN